MNCKHVAVVVVGLCACGQPPEPVFREVHLTPLVRTRQHGVVTHFQLEGAAPAYVGPTQIAPKQLSSGFSFSVPEGPALFRYGLTDFVYSDAAELSPCVEGASDSPVLLADGGVPYALTFAAPAQPGDVIQLTGPSHAWLVPDAGALEYRKTIDGFVPRFFPVTLSYLALQTADPDLTIWNTIAVADAGVMDEANPRVNATFVATPGTPVTLDWDADALVANQADAGTRRVQGIELTVRQNGLLLSRVLGMPTGHSMVSVAPAGLTPTHFEVWSTSIRLQLDGETEGYHFSFAVPWNEALSTRPPGGPPRNVELVGSGDGMRVRWTAPSPAPGAYRVGFMQQLTSNSYRALGTMMTDQTEVPVPAMFQVENLFVEVDALTGGGITAASCVADYKDRGAPWSQFLGRSP